jgi:twitching motility protein PilT
MQAGGRFGMQTMDASLARLVKAGQITHDLATERSHDPEELNRLLRTADGMVQGSAAGYGAKGYDVG